MRPSRTRAKRDGETDKQSELLSCCGPRYSRVVHRTTGDQLVHACEQVAAYESHHDVWFVLLEDCCEVVLFEALQ